MADILGKRDHDLYPDDLADQFALDDEYVLETGQVIHKFEQNVNHEGKRTWYEIIKGPLLDADNNISGVQILFWDASDRKRTEEALERERSLLHALLDNVPDSIYFKDCESRFVRISRGMAEKFNLPSTESAIGKTDADIFTAEHAQQARQDELRIMESREPVVNLIERETWRDREDTWCSTTKVPLRDHTGKIIGIVRRYRNGSKKTIRGGSLGLFYAVDWYEYSGPVLIVEGPSDVAACLTHGLCAIGRPSNVCGAAMIQKMLRRCRDKRAIVIGERDEAPERRGPHCPADCSGCAICWPGAYGMRRVARQLRATGVMIPPGYKDMRDLLANGTPWIDFLPAA